jgi:hypothetical protein
MIFLLLLLIVFVLLWATYVTLRDIIEGRWQPVVVAALLAGGLIFVVVGSAPNWLIALDAFACSDRAEIVIEAVPGPAAGGKGTIREWDFFDCAIHWYDRPGVRG